MKILYILFFSLLLNTSLASADEKPGRFFEDQPDVTDEHQIHFIYLLPSDPSTISLLSSVCMYIVPTL